MRKWCLQERVDASLAAAKGPHALAVAACRLPEQILAMSKNGQLHLREVTEIAARYRTGRIELTLSDQPIKGLLKGKPLSGFVLSDSRERFEKRHLCALLTRQEANFARFAFDLVAMLQGTYEPGRLSSFYGFGDSSLEEPAGLA
jgi:hypothetical protein